ncbi:lysophospholipid acyltransferase family protein [Rhizobium puerariae]|uniref:Lysophospholipid acyltransferase family protein n=1 Tax=Rhizobium puerariae TaxID=1585791 RepID=A0ABV6AN37_9HYPH
MAETEETPPAAGPTKRKAWLYKEAGSPVLADLFAGGDARRRFLDFWLRDNLGNAAEILLFFAFKLLPASLVSKIGSHLGRFAVPRWHKKALSRVRGNLRTIRPDASEAQIDRWAEEFAEIQGRQRTEYSVVQRLAASRRNIRFAGTENLVKECAGRPVIFIGFHTGNLEILWQCLVNMGLDVTTNYDPPKRPSHRWIANRVRRRGGLGLLPPGRSYVRPALRILESGGRLLIYCDEGFGGVMRAPFFGRRPHLQSNYALVSRMARKTGALIRPVYLTREGGTRFTFHALPAVDLPPEDTPGSRLLEDVILLNAVVEPVIAAHPGQWFFIDNRMVPL